jgi:8-oxo-dGTP pyrophosphatase MutT (NUDIX family)
MKKHAKWGVLPYRRLANGKVEFLVVSTTGGKWIFPKGNLIKRLGPAKTAQWEAFEEAGITGDIKDSLYSCKSKGKTFFFYPLKVRQLFSHWPESNFRTRKWIRPRDGKKYLSRKPLRRLMRSASSKVGKSS